MISFRSFVLLQMFDHFGYIFKIIKMYERMMQCFINDPCVAITHPSRVMQIYTTAVEHHPLVNQSYVYLLPRMCMVYSWLRHGIEKAVLRCLHIDVLVQERRISVANALELRLSWNHTSICDKSVVTFLCQGYYSISYRVWVMPLYDRYICKTEDQRRLAGLKSFHETWKYICISIIS